MRINWKIIIALLIMVGTIILTISLLRATRYSGSDLNLAVGNGLVTVTNPSDSSIPVRLTSTRSFSVSSSIKDVSGNSILQEIEGKRIQNFEFLLPSGVSDFTVDNGTQVNFVASAGTQIELAIQPFNESDTRNRIVVAFIIVLASLFFISGTNDHRWISAARRKKSVDQAAAQETERQNFQRILDGRASNKP